MPQPPRVFISYSHDSDEHRDFVLNLANHLRAEGVESWIDQYVPGFPAQGWQRWMEHEIEQADFVLLVCTPLYHQRFMGEDQEGGRGVNFEGVVISQLLYDGFQQNTKFLPVVPEGGHFEHVPVTLRSHFFQLENDYQKLYRVITRQPEVVPPPVAGQTVQLPPKVSTNTSPALSLESAYLESLLQQSQIRFADQTYTTLSGKFQQDRQLIPQECMMAASFLFESYTDKHELRECHSQPKQHEDLLAAFDQHKRLVLLGEPGTGKTFSLWRIAAERARQALAQGDGLLPVVIPLNRWTDEKQTLTDFIRQQTGSLKAQFQALCNKGRLLPLLDAMNEIPFDQRDIKLPQIRDFVNREEFKHLLLTCRQRDYSGQLEQDMHRLTIEPLDPPRVYQFLQNYFAYFAQQQPGEFKPGMADDLFWRLAGGEELKAVWQAWEKAGADFTLFCTAEEIPKENPDVYSTTSGEHDRLWEIFRKDPRSLIRLAANPYLLFLITSLYARYRELPKSRIDLFGRFVEVLIQRELKEKAESREYTPQRDGLLSELKQLAWQLQSRSGELDEARTVLSRSEAVAIMPDEHLEFAAAA
ncbi:MAG: SEFIR domain-containing protein, partial [Thiolinea sp.]